MLGDPARTSNYWIEAALSDLQYWYEEKLKSLEVITPEDVEAFIPELLKRGFVESLVHGNLTGKEAIEISELPTKILDLKPVESGELRKSHSLSIPKGTNLIYERDLIDPSNLNSAVNYFTDVGDITCHSTRTKLLLLTQCMKEPAFTQLRTIEQLGYIIKLKEMTNEEFEDQKISLIHRLSKDFENLWEEASHYWSHIHSGYYAFEERYEDAKMIQQITKSEMEEFYQTAINPKSTKRSKLSIQIKSQKVPVPIELIEESGLKEKIGQKKIDFEELNRLLKELGLSDQKLTKEVIEDVSMVKPVLVLDGIDGLRNRLEKTNCAIPHPECKIGTLEIPKKPIENKVWEKV
ncbi:insulinase [Melampsora larici-populina 98AG31]|uniref:Insulinase n=1 Tax=Melampsora larici-populina (strain 98AG31 / pathotype 3-4-7) TaxID=747676 RepID=F4S258_MELLP|nr:insulinase [Melampsora larici-populina 98AG31]EGG01315.1 insulinase [Melampsora larici-populina 98AG31]